MPFIAIEPFTDMHLQGFVPEEATRDRVLVLQ